MRFLSRKGVALLLFCAGVVLAGSAPALAKCPRWRGEQKVKTLKVCCFGGKLEARAKFRRLRKISESEMVTFIVDGKEYERRRKHGGKKAKLHLDPFPKTVASHTIRLLDAQGEFQCR